MNLISNLLKNHPRKFSNRSFLIFLSLIILFFIFFFYFKEEVFLSIFLFFILLGSTFLFLYKRNWFSLLSDTWHCIGILISLIMKPIILSLFYLVFFGFTFLLLKFKRSKTQGVWEKIRISKLDLKRFDEIY